MTTSSQARIAALEGWARTSDRTARTEAMRTGLVEKFRREARERLGPDATERQIEDAAAAARRAHYSRMPAAGYVRGSHASQKAARFFQPFTFPEIAIYVHRPTSRNRTHVSGAH